MIETQAPAPTPIPPARLQELNARSDLRGAMKVLSHLAAIACCSYALATSWGTVWMAPFFLLQGILLNFLYAGQHELSHWTVFKTRGLNSVFGHLFGFICFLPREHDRVLHSQHHRFTQDPLLDGELAGEPPFTLSSYLLYASGLSYWPKVISRMLATAAGFPVPAYFNPEQERLARKEARCYLLLYIGVALLSWYMSSWLLLQLWILPMLTTKFIHQCQNLTEHTGMPHCADITANTRTIRSNQLLDWLAWNMPYHTAHHRYPAVPFYRLPILHGEMFYAGSSRPETMGYLSFQWHMLRKLLRENTSSYTGKPLAEY